MIILGINDGHDSGVCLLQDGRVLLCSNEERRVNKKNVAGVPVQSIATVFKRTGINPKDVDLITLSSRIRTVQAVTQTRPIIRLQHLMYSAGKTEWGTRFGHGCYPNSARWGN